MRNSITHVIYNMTDNNPLVIIIKSKYTGYYIEYLGNSYITFKKKKI